MHLMGETIYADIKATLIQLSQSLYGHMVLLKSNCQAAGGGV